MTATGLSKDDIVHGLRKTALKRNDVVLVHSAMRTFGYVEGESWCLQSTIRNSRE